MIGCSAQERVNVVVSCRKSLDRNGDSKGLYQRCGNLGCYRKGGLGSISKSLEAKTKRISLIG